MFYLEDVLRGLLNMFGDLVPWPDHEAGSADEHVERALHEFDSAGVVFRIAW